MKKVVEKGVLKDLEELSRLRDVVRNIKKTQGVPKDLEELSRIRDVIKARESSISSFF